MATVEESDALSNGRTRSSKGSSVLPVHPTTLVIFGVTGDLAMRKLFPALYNLAHEGSLPERFNLIGIARRDLGDEVIPADAARVHRALLPPASGPARSSTRCCAERPLRRRHVRRLRRIRAARDSAADDVRPGGGRAVQPGLLPVDRAGVLPGDRDGARRRRPRRQGGLRGARGDREAVRPRSRVRPCAESHVLEVFDERQVFRIDHYLGKETVQNLLGVQVRQRACSSRSGTATTSTHVQITAVEDIGIGTRAELLRLFRSAARPRAEPHAPAHDTAVHGAAVVVLRRQAARREGQGRPGDQGRPPRKRCRAWRCAPSTGPECRAATRRPATSTRRECPDTSTTETYAALRLEVSNWRWAGVPVLPAHRQASRAAGSRRSPSS